MIRALACLLPLMQLAHGGDPPELIAARDCVLEADFRLNDCAGILHTARKRKPLQWLEGVIEYSAPALRAKLPRAQEIRTYPDGDVPGKSASFNRKWAVLRAFVRRVLAGEVRDPCPGAVYFGGKMDSPHGRMVPAKCAGSTANTFYALARGRR